MTPDKRTRRQVIDIDRSTTIDWFIDFCSESTVSIQIWCPVQCSRPETPKGGRLSSCDPEGTRSISWIPQGAFKSTITAMRSGQLSSPSRGHAPTRLLTSADESRRTTVCWAETISGPPRPPSALLPSAELNRWPMAWSRSRRCSDFDYFSSSFPLLYSVHEFPVSSTIPHS